MIIIEVAGHLGRDPETRFTPSGQKVTSFSIAANVRRSGKDETVWWRITVWGDRFDKLLPYLKKGSAVIVIGELGQVPQIYTDKNGQQQVSLELTAEIIRLSPFGRTDRPEGSPQAVGQNVPHAEPSQYSAQPSYGPQVPQATNYGAQRGYGAHQGMGMEQEDIMPDEDKLPF